MESSEHTELTSKIETDSQIESRLTAKGWGWLGGEGMEQKGKWTHGQQCHDCRGEEGIRGLYANGKNTMKIKEKNKIKQFQTYA